MCDHYCLQVLVFQYFLWVVLFIVFVMAATQLSVFGLIYLLAVFLFLYQGQGLLSKRRRRRRRWSVCVCVCVCVCMCVCPILPHHTHSQVGVS